jgi:hypothetical protein
MAGMFNPLLRRLVLLAVLLPACDPPTKPPADKPPAQPQAAAPKHADVGKNIVLETQGDTRRVRVAAVVSFREGALELLMCRRNTKEHEAVLSAEIDARQLHAALLLTGAKVGSPVKYEPKYTPASGSVIKVTVE